MYRYYSPYQSHLCCPFLQEVDGRRRLPAVTVRSEPEQNTNKKITYALVYIQIQQISSQLTSDSIQSQI